MEAESGGGGGAWSEEESRESVQELHLERVSMTGVPE